MDHPNESTRRKQEEHLKKLPEKDRVFYARMFRIGNATYAYYQQVGTRDLQPTQEHFKDWLKGLPHNIRKSLEMEGFEACKTSLPFRRFVLEMKDVGLGEWMEKHLAKDDFEYWSNQL